MGQRILGFIKKETVLTVALLLAVISCGFVTPDKRYMEYIDWRVLAILLSLMIIMAGFQQNGIFDRIGYMLLEHTKNTAQLCWVLVFLCYFCSMFITNDVALLTFVPFAMLTLRKCLQERIMIPVLVLQTIAANLGSMLTPIGNPQNLYLYNRMEMSLGEFIAELLPYAGASAFLLALIILILTVRKEAITIRDIRSVQNGNRKLTVVYTVLFVFMLFVVARLLPYQPVLVMIVGIVFWMDRKTLWQVDYCLIFTFIAFFVFTGNLGRIPVFRSTLQELVSGNEIWVGIAASQFISNVPAALLLADFADDLKKLLLGVNIGGLGTLIASMASLISYKIYAHNYNRTKGLYLAWFTAGNVLFLAVLAFMAVCMQNE